MSHKKFGPDRFSRFDVYWTQTDSHKDRQAKLIYRWKGEEGDGCERGKGGRILMCKGEGGKEMDVCKGEGGKVYLLFHLYLSSFHLVFSFLVDK